MHFCFWRLRVTKWVTEWLTKWVIEWLTGWVTKWLTKWVTKWLTEWLTEWLTKWVTEWLTGCLSEIQILEFRNKLKIILCKYCKITTCALLMALCPLQPPVTFLHRSMNSAWRTMRVRECASVSVRVWECKSIRMWVCESVRVWSCENLIIQKCESVWAYLVTFIQETIKDWIEAGGGHSWKGFMAKKYKIFYLDM